MTTHTGYVMTLANSIIGVSLLAMPYCFKQCGVLLGILLLIFSNIVTRLACHFLIKSATMCRRTSFEYVAYHAFGVSGKLLVELGVIGFMLGTSVAYFVVIGDLAPAIISKMFLVENNPTLRVVVLLVTGLLIILPLSLLRNIESLAAISTLSILFYMSLVIKVLAESFPHLAAADTAASVSFWRPEGILQCFPIFSVALSCQTQIFEILEVLPNPTMERMNSVVRSAVGLCTIIYILNGCLGYIAFAREPFGGNILLSFTPSLTTDLFQLGFVLSVALSFPIVVFPCRASLNSLLFKKGHQFHELNTQNSSIPDTRFKLLTAFIVGVALCTGIIVPNIEFVLGFVGSTIGVAICLIFPSGAFIHIQGKKTSERLVAKFTLALGIIVMVLGTYSNLETAAGKNVVVPVEVPMKVKPPEIPVLQPAPKNPSFGSMEQQKAPLEVQRIKPPPVLPKPEKNENRKEPPVPVAPELKKEPPLPIAPLELKKEERKTVSRAPDPVHVEQGKDKIQDSISNMMNEKSPKLDVDKNVAKSPGDSNKMLSIDKKPEEINVIHLDAIAKEEHELKENNGEEDQKQKELLEKLQQHQEEQKKLLEEQQSILDEIKNRENIPKPVEAIKPERFNDNIDKIQEVIDDLKERKQVMDKNKGEKIAEEKKKIANKKNENLKPDTFMKMLVSVAPLEKNNANATNATIIGAPIVQKEEVHKESAAAGRDILEENVQVGVEREKREVEDQKTVEESCKKPENKVVAGIERHEEVAKEKETESPDLNDQKKPNDEGIQLSEHLSPPENIQLPDKAMQEENSVNVALLKRKHDIRRRRK